MFAPLSRIIITIITTAPALISCWVRTPSPHVPPSLVPLATRFDPEGSKMADLEAVLADVSYLMAMEKSKSTPAARASKKIILPEPR